MAAATLINQFPNKDITLIECFTTIFFTNFIVGFFILFIMSFVTGGLLAIFVIFINGFILGRLFLELLNIEQISLKVKFFSIIHIPVEIYAFFLFSFYSYNGFYLILDMLKNDRINKTFFPSKEKILKPTLLLLLGAIIESLTIYYAIL